MNDTALRNYFMLRGAMLKHQQMPWQLSAAEQAELAESVRRELLVVNRAIASPVAVAPNVDGAAVQQAVAGFLNQMSSQGNVELLLNKAGLQQETLTTAIASEMKAAAVLEQLTSVAIPTEQEVQQWYENHPDRFVVPERREVFQILITVNDLYPENRRESARKRIDDVALMANTEPDAFGALALSYSECPSAVDSGRLGIVPPGQLYAELDHELFAMQSGAISCVVETPLGFHLLQCGVIEPSRRLAWDEVKDSLTRQLTEQKRKRFLKQWLRSAI